MTPMMRQYREMKKDNPDSILFFRLGDFYEMFDEDARVAAKELDIVLTTRDKKAENPADRIPMCGVPYHSAESYIARLIAKGYKVAICEQLEDPTTATGIVERGVVRIVTPGTLMESSMLDENKSNYLCAVYLSKDSAICFADLSTGEVSVSEFPKSELSHIENELSAYSPREAIVGGDCDIIASVSDHLKSRLNCLVTEDSERFDISYNSNNITQQFDADACSEISTVARRAVEGLLSYLIETQKTDLSHLKTLQINDSNTFMELDLNTIRNLELASSIQSGDKKSSLLSALDKTKTPMGRRLIRNWIFRPLLSVTAIKRRQSAVSDLVNATLIRSELILSLRKIGDIERLIAKIVYGNAGCRDLKALASSIFAIPELTALLSSQFSSNEATVKSVALKQFCDMDIPVEVAEQIDNIICDEPPFSVREGGFIRNGINAEVDRLRGLLDNSNSALTKIEADEREKTGKKLKIGYNKVFGYYIEIPRSSSDDVPPDYIRKQTLANCERFITEELKLLETELLSAKDNLTALEFKLFEELRLNVAREVERIQTVAKHVAELDVLCSFAETAALNNYCMPEIDVSKTIDICDGRHPVVEIMQQGSLFVPNDTYLDCDNSRTAIITGPNMAGKSTFMRQTALIVLMAQMGSYVPARSACIGIVDRVFTRIGASDDLSSGKSTFMVEMSEVADILKNATNSSLLILDEIGRGTSTYDGMSVARAVLEFCADKRKLGAKTMFATHYHELTALEDEIDGVKNYNISAKKRGDDIIFLRKIVPGGADDSYGIEVAGLAGVPESVIKRAKAVLKELEDNDPDAGSASNRKAKKDATSDSDAGQLTLIDVGTNELADLLKKTDLNTLSPLEALSLLFEMKQKL